MIKDRKIEPVKIQILSIKTLKGNIHAGDGLDTAAVDRHKFDFELGVGFNAEEKIIGLELTVNIQAISKTAEPLDLTASYTHEFIFQIENFDDFINKEGEQQEIKIDRIMAGTLAGIAYSTVRGIILTRTQGTSLNAVVLPVIDPKTLLSEHIVADDTHVEKTNMKI